MPKDPMTMFGSPEIEDLVKKAYETYITSLAPSVFADFLSFRAGFAYSITSLEVEIPGAYRFKKKQEKENDDAKGS